MGEKFEDLDFVIHGLSRGMIGQFIAQQSSYKTTLGLNLLMSMAAGRAFEPFTQAESISADGIVASSSRLMNAAMAKPRNVVFLDFENIPQFVQPDLATMYGQNFDEYERALIDDRFLPIISPQVRQDDDPDTDTQACLKDSDTVELIIDEINNYFGPKNTDLILIDTQAEAFDLENENDNGAKGAGLVINTLRRIAQRTGAAVVIIHHTAKSGEEANQRRDFGRGASRLGTAMRYVVRFDQSKDSGKRFIAGEITVENVKAKGPKFNNGDPVYFTHIAERRWMELGQPPAQETTPDDASQETPEPTDRDGWIAWKMEISGVDIESAKRAWRRKQPGQQPGQDTPLSAPLSGV
jgi:AAA domain-containing protein